MKIKAIFILLTALLISWGNAEKFRGEDVYLKELAIIKKQIPTATAMNLYEGLPHQTFEGDLLGKEMKRKDVVTYAKFPFYKKPFKLAKADEASLRKLLTDAKTFGSFYPYNSTSPKNCGGFHPDYCIELEVNKKKVHVLVCFGCHEVKIAHPEYKLYCNINRDAYKEFGRILKKYKKNRPARGK